MKTNGISQIHICTLRCGCAATSCCRSDLLGVEETGRTAVQAEGPSWVGFRQRWLQRSHALELINALFGVSWPDLSKGLVLVPSCLHVLCMEDVIYRLLALVTSIGQLWAQNLKTTNKSESINKQLNHFLCMGQRVYWILNKN